jgi:hypothetical protein
MILIGVFLILVGAQVISVFDNWSQGLTTICIGTSLIYGRYLLEKR